MFRLSGKAIAVTLAAAGGLLGIAFGGERILERILTYQLDLWGKAGTNLPPRLKLFGYAAGVGLAVAVGVVAPLVGRLGRFFESKAVAWLASFLAGVAAVALAVGGAVFAMGSIEWRSGTAVVWSLVQYLGVFAALWVGGLGAVKALKG